jgi:hypothetical protein
MLETAQHLKLPRGKGKEDETLENRGTVCLGPGAPFVGLGPALQQQWPQMVAPYKEKPPPEQRTPREAYSPREAHSPRLKTQNSE